MEKRVFKIRSVSDEDRVDAFESPQKAKDEEELCVEHLNTYFSGSEKVHDQVVLFQPLFLNLIQKHFFRVLSTPLGPFQELKEKVI